MKKIVVILHLNGAQHEMQGQRWEVNESGILDVFGDDLIATYPAGDWHAVYFADSVSGPAPSPYSIMR